MPNDLTARLVEALKEARTWTQRARDWTARTNAQACLDRIDALLAEAAQASAKPEAVACQYAQDVGMQEYRCVGRCQYAAPPAAPEGWVMVPREPTEEMLQAMRKAFPANNWKRRWSARYAYLLAAAPKEMPKDEHIRDLIGRGAGIVRRLYNETPNATDAVAAGEWIQYASQLLAAPKGER